jgi:uncharacterized membrane protein YeaQ/YmgE (transglycosylase-associated protein family)
VKDMGIVLFILFGALVGFIADYFDRSAHLTWLERTIVGIVGAVVGGTLYNLLTTGTFAITTTAGFNIVSLVVAVLGALVTLFVWKRIGHRSYW